MRQIRPRTAAIVALLSLAAFPAAAQRDEVLKADEAYRVAKLKRDLPALQAILADEFNETNQNGNSRDKAETLALWDSFSISSLTTDSSEVRLSGDTAMVTGTQTETAPSACCSRACI